MAIDILSHITLDSHWTRHHQTLPKDIFLGQLRSNCPSLVGLNTSHGQQD